MKSVLTGVLAPGFPGDWNGIWPASRHASTSNAQLTASRTGRPNLAVTMKPAKTGVLNTY